MDPPLGALYSSRELPKARSSARSLKTGKAVGPAYFPLALTRLLEEPRLGTDDEAVYEPSLMSALDFQIMVFPSQKGSTEREFGFGCHHETERKKDLLGHIVDVFRVMRNCCYVLFGLDLDGCP